MPGLATTIPPPSRNKLFSSYNKPETGMPIFFMRGNRDFLIGPNFAKETDVSLLADPCVIELYGKSILLTHGDSLCTFDRLHQYWCRLTRHDWNQWCVRLIPLNWRRRLATYLRQRSVQHQQKIADYILDVNQAAVVQMMQQHSVNLLIHGHTHKPGIHQFEIQGKNHTRIVLGSWHNHGSALRYWHDGTFELLELPYTSSHTHSTNVDTIV